MNNHECLILLVEDDPNDVEFVKRALKKNNLDKCLTRLSNGEEALNFIFNLPEEKHPDRDPNYPQIILLDLNMPKLSGFQVLQALRENRKSESICVIVLTTSSSSPDIKACYELGANGYIVKPFNFEKFAHAVSFFGFAFLAETA